MIRRHRCICYSICTIFVINYALYSIVSKTGRPGLDRIKNVIKQPIEFSKQLLIISAKIATTSSTTSTDTISTSTTTVTTTSVLPYRTSPNIYLLSAYLLLSHRELRLVGIMECWNKVNFFVNITHNNGSTQSFLLRKQGLIRGVRLWHVIGLDTTLLSKICRLKR